MRLFHVLVGCLLLTASTVLSHGQRFSTQLTTIIVPTAAGGAVDTLARFLGNQLSARWNQRVIVENKAGANTQVAAEFVARSRPDGHTLLLGPDVTFAVNPHLYKKLSYDPVRDFTPITGLTVLYQALVVHPSLPVNDLADFIALAKSKPGVLTYGTFGVGSAGHLNMEAFEEAANVRLTPVHYRGAAPATADVIAGHINSMFVSYGSVIEAARAGQLKILAIGRPARMPSEPNVPTIAESGVPGFEAKSWFGLFAPRGVPDNTIELINRDVAEILSDPARSKAFLSTQMMEVITSSPNAYAELINADSRRWKAVIDRAKLEME
jgi:tripartite-type tricarboxylate transporter receptor subunit TctC